MALKKICAYAGCNRLVDYGITYCGEHKKEHEKKQKLRHNEYKQNRQDKEEQAFYSTDAWILTRDDVKGKYKGLCLYSYYVLNEIVFCDMVHHIVELKEDWDLRLDEDNLIPLSASVHQIIHAMYRNGRREEAQRLLRDLKIRWEKEFNSI